MGKPSTNCSRTLTALYPARRWSSWPLPTGPRSSTLGDRDASTGPRRSPDQTKKSAPRSSPSIRRPRSSAHASTSTPCRVLRHRPREPGERAAVKALRAHRAVISADDFDAARDRLLMGRQDTLTAPQADTPRRSLSWASLGRGGPTTRLARQTWQPAWLASEVLDRCRARRYGPEGPIRDPVFAGRPYAAETQRATDTEVTRILREA